MNNKRILTFGLSVVQFGIYGGKAMADIKIAPEDVYTVDSDGNVFPCIYPNKIIGVAIEDSKRLGDVCDMDDYDTQVDMFPYTADDHVVNMVRTGVVTGTLPYASGVLADDAGKAMQTLPRIVQRIIYRYAKWKLRNE